MVALWSPFGTASLQDWAQPPPVFQDLQVPEYNPIPSTQGKKSLMDNHALVPTLSTVKTGKEGSGGPPALVQFSLLVVSHTLVGLGMASSPLHMVKGPNGPSAFPFLVFVDFSLTLILLATRGSHVQSDHITVCSSQQLFVNFD